MLTIKLTSSNYLLWRNQISPLLLHQNWMQFVDRSYPTPSKFIIVNDKETPNPNYLSWVETYQKVLLILQTSLSEEAMAEVINLSSFHVVWKALESTYNHDSIERSQNLKDYLRQLKRVIFLFQILLNSSRLFVISLLPLVNRSLNQTKATSFCVF